MQLMARLSTSLLKAMRPQSRARQESQQEVVAVVVVEALKATAAVVDAADGEVTQKDWEDVEEARIHQSEDSL